MWRCHISRSDFARDVTIGLADVRADGSVDHIEGPLTVKRYPEFEIVTGQPFFRGDREDVTQMLQAIVDEAWAYGIRPSVVPESASKAQADHLKDMRAIVAKTVGVDLP